ncbi:hypothetical protein MPTK1_2g18630 [Marchantia polymorpha subsp. ruderalis]|uniref:Uncharacterized protein n=1 Tax=Marchantia polymorpha TaxID=3197 RepID=A0A2R6W717_MARPO|nr:hypothetical protein MARPO_0137s0018 [Marchantia polymorpha]BBN02845.1 hypothetical protein Mp_2g18630 [Marchantia polymorpha subsp. ruderalis]|eukprot:PTQ29650.1 hypothetical protein MARPO_0137s0018 [Marchantia polymorpha]
MKACASRLVRATRVARLERQVMQGCCSSRGSWADDRLSGYGARHPETRRSRLKAGLHTRRYALVDGSRQDLADWKVFYPLFSHERRAIDRLSRLSRDSENVRSKQAASQCICASER